MISSSKHLASSNDNPCSCKPSQSKCSWLAAQSWMTLHLVVNNWRSFVYSFWVLYGIYGSYIYSEIQVKVILLSKRGWQGAFFANKCAFYSIHFFESTVNNIWDDRWICCLLALSCHWFINAKGFLISASSCRQWHLDEQELWNCIPLLFFPPFKLAFQKCVILCCFLCKETIHEVCCLKPTLPFFKVEE